MEHHEAHVRAARHKMLAKLEKDADQSERKAAELRHEGNLKQARSMTRHARVLRVRILKLKEAGL